jgi:branched-chain amino acid aminotransferase
MVSNGAVLTPPLSSSILAGITRDSVIQICHELGITIKERSIQRAALYVADELFFSGTAAEITPIRSVDRIAVGAGGRGEITEKIQKAFFEITKGERKAPGDWLTYVKTATKSQARNNGNSAEKGSTVEAPVQAADRPALKYQTAAAITE